MYLENWMIAVLVAAIVAEALVPLLLKWRHRYTVGHSLATIAVLAGYLGATAMGTVILAGAARAVYDARAFDIPPTWWGFALGFVTWDFMRYWRHRAEHNVRWLWASHAVHHSSTELNFLSAFRQGWTELLSGTWLLVLPYLLFGFGPEIAIAVLIGQYFYELWIHNEWMPKLGPLEWLFVTPSNHRVHHGLNAPYLDRNYGGMLIVWDRLFGTFVEEDPHNPPRFGLLGRKPSNDPVRIAFYEWYAIARDAFSARSLKDVALALVRIPAAVSMRRKISRK